MDVRLSFGRWLKRRRLELDLTQAELAREVGYSIFTIRKVELDTLRPSVELAERLADHLGVAVQERAAFVRFARGRIDHPPGGVVSLAGHEASHNHLPISNLPTPPTTLIGREREVAHIADLVRGDARLLTVAGPGGVGKTRLVIEVGWRVLDHFAGVVVFVTLASITDPTRVVPTIAHTLGIPELGHQTTLDELKTYLHHKHLLLVLDNFEHVVAAAPELADLLSAAPRLKMLVTSREVLRLQAEREFPLSPFTLPLSTRSQSMQELSHNPAIALFVQRAQAHFPDFQLTHANASSVIEICRRLDGLPLAIELAAGYVKLFPPEMLVMRLRQPLHALTGGARDLPARQQTMRDAIAWSYDLLTESEKTLFRRLAVFVGGFTLAAAEAVCGAADELEVDLANGVGALVDKSLVQQQPNFPEQPVLAMTGGARFGMLETIREYGLERLMESGEGADLRQRHAEFFAQLTEQAHPYLLGSSEEMLWLARLEAERDNLYTALATVLDTGNVAIGMQLASVWEFWVMTGQVNQGRRWLHTLLEAPGADGTSAAVRADALYGAAILAVFAGDRGAAQNAARESLSLAQQMSDDFRAARIAPLAANSAADMAIAAEESLGVLRQRGDEAWLALLLMQTGSLAKSLGNYVTAQARLEESLALYRKLNARWHIPQPLNGLGDLARLQGNYGRAGELYAESLARYRETGNKADIPAVLHNLGYVALHQNNYAQATTLFIQSLTLHQELSNQAGMAEALTGLAAVDVRRGEAERAARLFGAAERLFEVASASPSPADRGDVHGTLAALREQFDSQQMARYWAEGRAMMLEQAVAYAKQ